MEGQSNGEMCDYVLVENIVLDGRGSATVERE